MHRERQISATLLHYYIIALLDYCINDASFVLPLVLHVQGVPVLAALHRPDQ